MFAMSPYRGLLGKWSKNDILGLEILRIKLFFLGCVVKTLVSLRRPKTTLVFCSMYFFCATEACQAMSFSTPAQQPPSPPRSGQDVYGAELPSQPPTQANPPTRSQPPYSPMGMVGTTTPTRRPPKWYGRDDHVFRRPC